MKTLVAAIVLLSAPVSAWRHELPTFVQLPHPSGPYAVGRVGYDWIDQSRRDEFAQTPDAHRELMVYIWYPAKKQAAKDKPAGYLPEAKFIQEKLSPDELEGAWGPLWRRIFSGEIGAGAYENAPIAGGHEHFPLVVFSSGLGVPVTAYTTMFQEIASHGYIVAAIEPVYESAAVAFPDGRVVRSVAAANVSRRPQPGETRKQLLDRARKEDVPLLDRRSGDIRFVIDQLRSLRAGQLAGRVDFGQIGAWGHSIGGRAAARACQLDRHIKACLSADGGGLDGPVAVYPGAALPSQPFMLMSGPAPPPPTDAVLASYSISREDWQKERDARNAAYEQQFQNLTGGSYRVTFTMPEMAHMSFSDQPLLEAADEGGFRRAAQNLSIIERYTLAFFDRYLKHRSGTILDSTQKTPAGVEVTKYAR